VGIVADDAIVFDHRTCVDDDARADLCMRIYHGQCHNNRSRANFAGRRKHSGGMNKRSQS